VSARAAGSHSRTEADQEARYGEHRHALGEPNRSQTVGGGRRHETQQERESPTLRTRYAMHRVVENTLIPAIRPFNSKSVAAPAPINRPPQSDAQRSGVIQTRVIEKLPFNPPEREPLRTQQLSIDGIFEEPANLASIFSPERRSPPEPRQSAG